MVGSYSSKRSSIEEQSGITPRALAHIFETIDSEGDEFTYEVQVGFLQIYMEMVQDLLDPKNEDVRIREDPALGVFVSGITYLGVKNVHQAMGLFAMGEKNRAVAFTRLNAHSSRSHAVFMVKIERAKSFTLEDVERLEKKRAKLKKKKKGEEREEDKYEAKSGYG